MAKTAAIEQAKRDIFDEPPAPGALAPPVVRATDLTGVHVVKSGDMFLTNNAHGDVRPDGRGLGLFLGDTRFLSTYDLVLNGTHPIVLRPGPAASQHSVIQMANPDLLDQDGGVSEEVVLRRHSLGVVRDRTVSDRLSERVTVTNYTTRAQRARLTLMLDADYADIFELRGLVRERRGDRLANEWSSDGLTFKYRGLDGIERRTVITLAPVMRRAVIAAPDTVLDTAGTTLELDWLIEPGKSETLAIEVRAETRDGSPQRMPPQLWPAGATFETNHALAEHALERSRADLDLLLNDGPGAGEQYIAAGVPWFSCLFGRDSIITSLQMLAVRPEIARATLSILARFQATEMDEFRDAAPGKILHELRTGELARTDEIPHTPYYGTVDATPLWLMLLDEYERWTGDSELVDQLWPNALAALEWLDRYGDLDGDGFIEYTRQSERGLVNQGWKDSADSNRNRDGTLAEGPIALVEVQAYAYAARRGMARLARVRGDDRLAAAQDAAAEALRQHFENAFWMEDAGTYAMALDGAKRQVTGIASNAGHVLWTGIADQDRAARAAEVLTGRGMWSGWGIRTLSAETIGYNPIGYHLGTIWPHDNAICAAGFARYGLFEETRLVAGALFEATAHFSEARLPELFCGFERATSPLPVPYPVACSPQAWAAGSLYHLMAATLGMRPDARGKRLELVRPGLPTWLPSLQVRGLRVGDARVDLEFATQADSISVEVLRRSADLDVVVRR
ncbi:MAG TPA: glycogen debranching N-terminal domain-containing protein [Candidatus Limnocylindria bacterium]|nr:glycogen debranching N-terminal domain-containing protein [Candidatus Limnocylindria bacterium]